MENKKIAKNNLKIKIGFIKLLAFAMVVTLLFLSLVSCGNKAEAPKSREYYDYFDTTCIISDYSGGSEESFRQVYQHFEDRLDFYHQLFDIYHEYDGINNIATVNRLAGISAVKVDKELIDFLEYAIEMYNLTDGNMNIAMGSVLSIWHEYRSYGVAIPEKEELLEANKHTDISCLVIDRDASTVYLTDPEMSLDVGALAKGYTAERIAQSLISRGLSSYVLNLGGNLRIIGTKVGGGDWKVGIQNPDLYSSEKYVYYANISNTSMVTSGDYIRFYVVDGVKYHHIIDNDTLMPADYFSSVTIFTEDSGLADAMSTALFNMDYESGVNMLSRMNDISVVWITTEGEILTYGID